VTQAQRLTAIRERILEALGDGGVRAQRKPRAAAQSQAAK